MDWSNERYVRVYTRDTPEWVCMPWEARALWPLLLRKVDRAGVFANKLGIKGVAAIVMLPLEIVEVGLAALLDDGCVQSHQLGLVIPNFIEAQEAMQSDAQRKRNSRELRRMVTSSDQQSQNVTKSHDRSQAVTVSHGQSQIVTPSLAEPSQDLSCLAPQDAPPPVSPKAELHAKLEAYTNQIAEAAVQELNRITRSNYRATGKGIRKLARALAKNEYTPEHTRLVVITKCKEWLRDEKMHKYLRPATLLALENFSNYLDDAQSKASKPASPPTTTPDEPPHSTLFEIAKKTA